MFELETALAGRCFAKLFSCEERKSTRGVSRQQDFLFAAPEASLLMGSIGDSVARSYGRPQVLDFIGILGSLSFFLKYREKLPSWCFAGRKKSVLEII